MTDLSKLADALIELINSKPRSPTRDEVMAVLKTAMSAPMIIMSVDTALAGSDCTVYAWGSGGGSGGGNTIFPLPYKEPSTEMVQLLRQAHEDWLLQAQASAIALANPWSEAEWAREKAALEARVDRDRIERARPAGYLVSQAQLDKALSCENGCDWKGPWAAGEMRRCHRCGQFKP